MTLVNCKYLLVVYNLSDIGSFLLPSDPLPPEHLKLSNDGHRMRSLHASWQNPFKSGGFYVGVLLETKSQLVIKNLTLAEANITFEMLIPGRQYTLKLARVAGPFQSHVQIVSDWICEYAAILSSM